MYAVVLEGAVFGGEITMNMRSVPRGDPNTAPYMSYYLQPSYADSCIARHIYSAGRTVSVVRSSCPRFEASKYQDGQ